MKAIKFLYLLTGFLTLYPSGTRENEGKAFVFKQSSENQSYSIILFVLGGMAERGAAAGSVNCPLVIFLTGHQSCPGALLTVQAAASSPCVGVLFTACACFPFKGLYYSRLKNILRVLEVVCRVCLLLL